MGTNQTDDDILYAYKDVDKKVVFHKKYIEYSRSFQSTIIPNKNIANVETGLGVISITTTEGTFYPLAGPWTPKEVKEKVKEIVTRLLIENL